MSGIIDGIKKLFGGGASAGPLRSAEGEAGRVLALLGEVIDPELDLDIVNLGLIRGVLVEPPEVRVQMTLTTEGCPVGPALVEEVERVLREAELEPQVELVFTPRWHPDDVSPAGRRQLEQ